MIPVDEPTEAPAPETQKFEGLQIETPSFWVLLQVREIDTSRGKSVQVTSFSIPKTASSIVVPAFGIGGIPGGMQ